IGDIASAIPVTKSNPNTATVSTNNKRIKIATDTNQKVEIIGLTGAVVYSTTITPGETEINLNRQGVYVVRLTNMNGPATFKVALGFSE
ncbi:T9SS type A sorting domain-containing protein, partial [bacterium]|nr:T9SS type A sorting domain-containing protein [bacterium]